MFPSDQPSQPFPAGVPITSTGNAQQVHLDNTDEYSLSPLSSSGKTTENVWYFDGSQSTSNLSSSPSKSANDTSVHQQSAKYKSKKKKTKSQAIPINQKFCCMCPIAKPCPPCPIAKPCPPCPIAKPCPPCPSCPPCPPCPSCSSSCPGPNCHPILHPEPDCLIPNWTEPDCLISCNKRFPHCSPLQPYFNRQHLCTTFKDSWRGCNSTGTSAVADDVSSNVSRKTELSSGRHLNSSVYVLVWSPSFNPNDPQSTFLPSISQKNSGLIYMTSDNVMWKYDGFGYTRDFVTRMSFTPSLVSTVDGSPLKLGLFVGKFDPFTNNHDSILRQVAINFHFDYVLLLPAATVALSSDISSTRASFADRVAMCYLGLTDGGFQSDDFGVDVLLDDVLCQQPNSLLSTTIKVCRKWQKVFNSEPIVIFENEYIVSLFSKSASPRAISDWPNFFKICIPISDIADENHHVKLGQTIQRSFPNSVLEDNVILLQVPNLIMNDLSDLCPRLVLDFQKQGKLYSFADTDKTAYKGVRIGSTSMKRNNSSARTRRSSSPSWSFSP